MAMGSPPGEQHRGFQGMVPPRGRNRGRRNGRSGVLGGAALPAQGRTRGGCPLPWPGRSGTQSRGFARVSASSQIARPYARTPLWGQPICAEAPYQPVIGWIELVSPPPPALASEPHRLQGSNFCAQPRVELASLCQIEPNVRKMSAGPRSAVPPYSGQPCCAQFSVTGIPGGRPQAGPSRNRSGGGKSAERCASLRCPRENQCVSRKNAGN